MWSKSFWVDAVERALRTVAQAVLSVITIDGVTPNLEANWQGIGLTAALAGVISLLMSIVASNVGTHTTAALVTPEEPSER